MKLFKSVDEKLADLGFVKVIDNNNVIQYNRYISLYKYTHVVGLYRKDSGNHIIRSYDKNLFDIRGIGNTTVGLTYKEAKLFLKKMRQMGLAQK